MLSRPLRTSSAVHSSLVSVSTSSAFPPNSSSVVFLESPPNLPGPLCSKPHSLASVLKPNLHQRSFRTDNEAHHSQLLIYWISRQSTCFASGSQWSICLAWQSRRTIQKVVTVCHMLYRKASSSSLSSIMHWCSGLTEQLLSSSWDGRPFGHNRHGPKNYCCCCYYCCYFTALIRTTQVSWYQKKHSPTHLSWSSSNLYQLLPLTTIHSIFIVQFACLTIFLNNLFPSPREILIVNTSPLSGKTSVHSIKHNDGEVARKHYLTRIQGWQYFRENAVV